MLVELLAALLHLHQHARFPDKVRKRRSASAPRLDALLKDRARLEHALMPKCLEEPIQENLCLSLLIAVDVRRPPRDELLHALPSLSYRRIAAHTRSFAAMKHGCEIAAYEPLLRRRRVFNPMGAGPTGSAGGHFAAMEQPEIFVNELRQAFRSFRP
jgi:hypothetical protein